MPQPRRNSGRERRRWRYARAMRQQLRHIVLVGLTLGCAETASLETRPRGEGGASGAAGATSSGASGGTSSNGGSSSFGGSSGAQGGTTAGGAPAGGTDATGGAAGTGAVSTTGGSGQGGSGGTTAGASGVGGAGMGGSGPGGGAGMGGSSVGGAGGAGSSAGGSAGAASGGTAGNAGSSGSSGAGGSAGCASVDGDSSSANSCPGFSLPTGRSCWSIEASTGPASNTNTGGGQCGANLGGGDYIYSFVAPQTGTVSIDVSSGAFVKGVYVSEGSCSGNVVGCDYANDFSSRFLQVATTQGTEYWVYVDSPGLGEWGFFTLNIQY